jgi:hypothetical protein
MIFYRAKSLQASMVLAAACLFALPGTGRAQTPSTTYIGEAAVAVVKVLGIANVSLEDTGPLPKSGGSRSAELAHVNIPNLLDLNLLDATTNGANNRTNSAASVANVTLSVAGIYITASVLTSNATAFCETGNASVSGASTIAALTVNGLSVNVTGQPNQTIPLIVGSLVINEQISSTTISPQVSSADIVVNALHLRVDLLADVVISSSHAGMRCLGGTSAKLTVSSEAGVELIWTAVVPGPAGNNLTLAYLAPNAPNVPLSIAVVDGVNIQVTLATDSFGNPSSLGGQIAALANSTPAVSSIATVTVVQGGFLEGSFPAENFSGGQ